MGDGAGGAGAARDDAAGAWDEEEEDEEEDAFGAQAQADADAEADAAAEDAEPAAEEPPFDAAVSLLRRRLLRGEGEVELGGQLQKNYRRARTQHAQTRTRTRKARKAPTRLCAHVRVRACGATASW